MPRNCYRSRVLARGFASLLLALLLAACTPFAVNATIPTPAPTPKEFGEPLAVPQSSSLPIGDALTDVVPSPDGTLLYVAYQGGIIKIYTLSGQEQGRPYQVPENDSGNDTMPNKNGVAWLPDSSGFLIVQDPEPLLLVDRQAHVRSTGLKVTAASVSPDERWIGGTSDSYGQTAEIEARSGGPVHQLALGGIFLGWQDNRAIYSTGGYGSELYAMNPDTGATQFLAVLPEDETAQLPSATASSPDGSVLLLALANSAGDTIYRMLVGNQVLIVPPATLQAEETFAQPALGFPLVWAGGHDLVVSVRNELVVEDSMTGKILLHTGAMNMHAMAISGTWIMASKLQGYMLELYLVDMISHSIYDIGHDLGSEPVLPLGNQGRFVIRREYIIDPAHFT